jgi:hypothetical protein
VNEPCLGSASAPRAGEEWRVLVDLFAHPRASASLVLVSDRALEGVPSRFGELLVDAAPRRALRTSFVVSREAVHVHEFSIPAVVLGRSFSLQALILEEHGSVLTNALDVVVGPERSP